MKERERKKASNNVRNEPLMGAVPSPRCLPVNCPFRKDMSFLHPPTTSFFLLFKFSLLFLALVSFSIHFSREDFEQQAFLRIDVHAIFGCCKLATRRAGFDFFASPFYSAFFSSFFSFAGWQPVVSDIPESGVAIVFPEGLSFLHPKQNG